MSFIISTTPSILSLRPSDVTTLFKLVSRLFQNCQRSCDGPPLPGNSLPAFVICIVRSSAEPCVLRLCSCLPAWVIHSQAAASCVCWAVGFSGRGSSSAERSCQMPRL